MNSKLELSDSMSLMSGTVADGRNSPENVPDLLFRRLMGSFATGVSVVTTRDVDDVPLGFTANAVSSVSRTPPLMLVCVAHSLFSLGAIRRSKSFAVNFMDQHSESIARRFGGRHANKFDGVDFDQGVFGLPILSNALACAECELHQIFESGDHSIMVGRIVGGRVADSRKPLLYFRGEFSNWGDRAN